MSHFTKICTEISNRVALKVALENLGYTVVESEVGVEVRGYRKQLEKADLKVSLGRYDIGFVLAEDGTYQMVADWWGVETTKGISENEFVEQVTQQYAYVQVVNTVQEKGYAVEEQTTNEDGSISLKVGKWG